MAETVSAKIESCAKAGGQPWTSWWYDSLSNAATPMAQACVRLDAATLGGSSPCARGLAATRDALCPSLRVLELLPSTSETRCCMMARCAGMEYPRRRANGIRRKTGSICRSDSALGGLKDSGGTDPKVVCLIGLANSC